MELRQLEYFMAVVDLGSMTDAARHLFVSQPALSQAIHALERDLAVDLFSRSARRLALTEAGTEFVEHARQIIAGSADARNAVKLVTTLESGSIDIAATPALSVDLLPRLAGNFHRRHPGVEIRASAPGGPEEVANAVREGRSAIGLAEVPFRVDGLSVGDLGAQDMVLALSHDLAEGLPEPLPLLAVRDVPMIIDIWSGSDFRSMPDLRDALGSIVIECAHRQAVWELVLQGAGAAFLSADLVRSELPNVATRTLSPLVRRRLAVMVRQSSTSTAAQAFLDINSLVVSVRP